MMRGASVEALEELTGMVEKSRTLADAETLGDELFGVVRVLREQLALRRALTDNSLDVEAREGLAGSVFGSALQEATLAVVSAASGKRWTLSRDMPDALEQLGVLATVRSAGKAGTAISDELFSVRELVGSDEDLVAALADPARTAVDRGALLTGLMDGKTMPATERLVTRAISESRTTLDAKLASYQQLAADAHGETIAMVHTARELSEADQDRLVTALGKQYDTKVHLHVVVDPSLVGGLRIEIRDDVIDGTVVNRLDDARRLLAG